MFKISQSLVSFFIKLQVYIHKNLHGLQPIFDFFCDWNEVKFLQRIDKHFVLFFLLHDALNEP